MNTLRDLMNPNQYGSPVQVNMNAGQRQPMNTIRVESTGEYLTPQGTRSATPVQFGGMQQQGQEKDYSRPPVQLPDGRIGLRSKSNPNVIIAKDDSWTVDVTPAPSMEEQMDQMKFQQAQLGLQKARQELQGEGVKPTFNAEMGGYIYPPSQENPQGRFVPVEGAKRPEKPMTEFQGKAALFGSRAAAASDLIDKFGGEEAGGAKTLQYWQDVPIAGRVANVLASGKEQELAQAQRDFVNAVLRLESGAVIGPEEFKNASQQYFPQPGDSPQVVEQKRQNRELAIQGLTKLAGGSGGEYIQEQRAARETAQQSPRSAPKGAPKTGEKVGGYMFLGGNPADPARWRKM